MMKHKPLISMMGILCLGIVCVLFPDPYRPPTRNKNDKNDWEKNVKIALDLKDYPRAIQYLEKAESTTADKTKVFRYLVDTYQKIGENDRALEAMRKAFDARPTDTGLAMDYINLCMENGDPATARMEIENLIKTEDEDIRSWCERNLKTLNDQVDPQINRWVKAVEKKPNDFSLHYELAKLYESKNMTTQALHHFLRSWFIRPTMFLILPEIADAFNAEGETEKAQAAFLVALCSPSPHSAEAARQALQNTPLTEKVFTFALELAHSNETLKTNIREYQSQRNAPSPTPPAPLSPPEPTAWEPILNSINLSTSPHSLCPVTVIDHDGPSQPTYAKRLLQSVGKGQFIILQGSTAIASELGFQPTAETLAVRNVEDHRNSELPIIWEKPWVIPRFRVPAHARIFARERWSRTPLVAGFRHGKGAVLWIACSPGPQGFERFPYLLQYMTELGLKPPFASRRLWAFLDTSYRSGIDTDYFAKIWRKMGISALHIAAWHYYDPDPDMDDALDALIASCHNQGILVYAWLELPHVSEKFWNDHPEWREKTAILQDAKLDWRSLMNLTNPDCFHAVSQGTHRLLHRFDWDGVNLAELYFESLEGLDSPSRFTPMNPNVRNDFKAAHGFDPAELFDPASPTPFKTNPTKLRQFLDYRIALARKLQEDWIKEIERFRTDLPQLDLVLTHVDDRFDPRMGDLIGADAAGLLKLLDTHDITFLIEDPAPLWNLGPQRYPQIAERYRPLTRHQEKLAIDINIVERGGNEVFPTFRQTGIELFQLLHLAALSFARVTIYAENTVFKSDLELLPAALSAIDHVNPNGTTLTLHSPFGVGLSWKGAARVDGKPWPVTGDGYLWLPAGEHHVSPSRKKTHLHLIDFNGELQAAESLANGMTFTYRSSSRALACLDRKPLELEIDGKSTPFALLSSGKRFTLSLPRGNHTVTVRTGVKRTVPTE
ncbi:MAG: tetratricopeptide repeat protein [Candidatus Omnitrophota bacterium]